MKKLSYPLTLIAFVFLTLNQTWAQSDYKTAIGGRLGAPIAGSIKHFITEAGALEGYLGFRDAGSTIYYNGINVTIGGMYQHHFPIGDIDGFKWYIGGGALIQFYDLDDNNNHEDYSSTGFALNAVGGVDYKFKSIPLNLSVDWMPTVFLNKTYYDNPDLGYGGIGVRYTFR
jgi:hypothetical protein